MQSDPKIHSHMKHSTLPGFDDHMRVTCEVLLVIGASFFLLYGVFALLVLLNIIAITPLFYGFIDLLLWITLMTGPLMIGLALIGLLTTPKDFLKVEKFFVFSILAGAVYFLLSAFFLFY